MYLGDKSLVNFSGVGCWATFRRHEHGLSFSCGGGSVAKQDQSLELSATERRTRVVDILAGGLVRLQRRGTLGFDGIAASQDSSADSERTGNSRLESSAKSGLTVQNG